MTKRPESKVVLQALLILDTFDKRLGILEYPVGVISFAGHNFLDYALDCLSYTETKEVFILTSADDDSFLSCVRKRMIVYESSFQIHLITCSKCTSFGDLMQDIDKKGLIKSDFILTQCGVVCNSDLKAALHEHRTRRQKDKNCVMTLVYSRCSADNLARTSVSSPTVALQSTTKKLLFYKSIAEKECTVKMALDVFTLNENVEVFYDLLDCNIAICSPQVLAQFSDNFDFETRTDLIREILTNDEILGYSAHVHILEDSMAVFVSDYSSYIFHSMRVLERYASPSFPDMLISPEVTNYTWLKRNLYVCKDGLQLAKTANLVKNVLLGQGCKVGEKVVLENCVIGANCTVGNGCRLKNCILWDNVTLGSNCTVNEAVLCNFVRLADSCTVQRRCILLNKVSLGPDSKIEAGSTISSKDSVYTGDVIATALPEDLSPARLFKLNLKSSRDDFWPEMHPLNLLDQLLLVSDDFVNESSEADALGHAEFAKNAPRKTLVNSMDQLSVDENDRVAASDEDTDDENEESFFHLVSEILHRGFEENIDCSNLILEINCAKPTYNVSVEQFNTFLTMALLSISAQANVSIASVLKYFLPVLRNYMKSTDSQRHSLLALQDYCHKHADFGKQLASVLHYLYDNSVLEEEAILEWAKNTDKFVLEFAQPFIQWLEQADEETESEED